MKSLRSIYNVNKLPSKQINVTVPETIEYCAVYILDKQRKVIVFALQIHANRKHKTHFIASTLHFKEMCKASEKNVIQKVIRKGFPVNLIDLN